MFKWIYVFNTLEFDDLGLVSRTYTLDIAGIGVKDILVTKGNLYSLTYDGVMLSPNFEGKNPFEFDGHAAYLYENGDVVLGIPVGA